ncbi:DUF4352 domain-containing protein [Saccharothrix longispora]|uniref:DUF4352 domain-containing protein n=1 Tax=Saccharothrix longispora TaxID=33920 RepID=A0ABU1PYP8_9PSEU|nr:DUF4352 domain-containing protein [Saccharothrix longispora]MDR6595774.1 hypothetical protein [Saccharothrix longispora]
MRAVWAVAVAASVLVGGCTGGPVQTGSTPTASSAETYPVPVQTVRPDERALHVPTTSDGDTAFTLLGLTTGIDAIIGSHAEFEAKGRFVRVRMSVVNNGRSSVSFAARRHVLVDDRKGEHATDAQAMTIKRQPDVVDLGANVRLEYDVYYDLPEDVKPLALRVYGGPTLTDLEDGTGTDIPLTRP